MTKRYDVIDAIASFSQLANLCAGWRVMQRGSTKRGEDHPMSKKCISGACIPKCGDDAR